MPADLASFAERFPELVARHSADGCWIWTGTIGSNGYGRFGGSARYAHRLSYELHVGPIPDGLHIDHLCCTPRCVNPAHLEPVTQQENSRRVGLRRTHCGRGHEFTPENTYVRPDDGITKQCIACIRERSRRYNEVKYARRRAAGVPVRRRLTEDDVRAMRAAHAAGETQASLARRYGVSQSAAWSAISSRGSGWRHVA